MAKHTRQDFISESLILRFLTAPLKWLKILLLVTFILFGSSIALQIYFHQPDLLRITDLLNIIFYIPPHRGTFHKNCKASLQGSNKDFGWHKYRRIGLLFCPIFLLPCLQHIGLR